MTSAPSPTATAPSVAPGIAPGDHRTAYDPDRAWTIHPQVSLRPESFGALAYHFGTRRLSFLKSPALADVVRTLAEHPTGREACAAAGIGPEEAPAVDRALATLAATGMICERPS